MELESGQSTAAQGDADMGRKWGGGGKAEQAHLAYLEQGLL